MIREEFFLSAIWQALLFSVYISSAGQETFIMKPSLAWMKVTLSTDWQRLELTNRVANPTPLPLPEAHQIPVRQATSSCNAHPTLPTQGSPTPGPSSQQRNERHHLFLSSWYRAALCRETASPKGVHISPRHLRSLHQKGIQWTSAHRPGQYKDNQPGWTFLFISSVSALGHNLKVQWVSPHLSPSPASNQNKTTQPFPWKLHSLQKGQVQKPHHEH